MENLQIFENAEFGSVRTLEINNEPYFVGKDVANALGYIDTNKAIASHVDDDDKLKDKTALSLGQRGGWVINESGLYCLILSSKLPTAKKFKRWVTSEVLPSIRKNGAYMTPQTIEQVLTSPDFLIRLATELKTEQQKNKSLALENSMQRQVIQEMEPKINYVDSVLNNPSLVTITQIAKDYGLSGRAMNNLLKDLKIQYKQSDQWMLYSKYQKEGYTHSKTIDITHSDGTRGVKMETKWTQKGRLFVYEKLKKKKILPLIEQDRKED